MKRTLFSILLISLTLISVLTLSGCSETPLFYTISNSTAVEDGSLNNRITFQNMGVFDTNYYVGAGKRIWSRPIAGGGWSKIALPSGYNESESGVSSMAIVGTNLYVSVYKSPQSTSAVFRKPDMATDWIQVTDSIVSDSRTDYIVYKLFKSGTNLYINRIEYNIYDVYGHEEIIVSSLYRNSLAAGSIVTVDGRNNIADSSGQTGVIVNMTSNALIFNVYDNNEGFNGVFCRGGGTNFPSVAAPMESEQYYAIGEGGGNTFLSVKDDDGTNPVYYCPIAGGAWSTLGAFPEENSLISCFLDISTIQANTILMGTTDYVTSSLYAADGYYEINTSTYAVRDNTFSDSSNYTSTDDDLRYATISRFVIDNNTIFALTQNHGLWRNKIEGSSRIWVWE